MAKLRFSLLTVLLLTTIVAMALTIAQMWQQLRPLRSENRRLRDEIGELSVVDPTRPIAIRVRTTDEFAWKWRVWVPEGQAFMIHLADEEVPAKGFPAGIGSIRLSDAGENWIVYRITPDARSGKWMDHLMTKNGSVGSAQQDWITWNNRATTSEGVSYETREFTSGETILLHRERMSQRAKSLANVEDPAAGFMIWLDPVK